MGAGILLAARLGISPAVLDVRLRLRAWALHPSAARLAANPLAALHPQLREPPLR